MEVGVEGVEVRAGVRVRARQGLWYGCACESGVLEAGGRVGRRHLPPGRRPAGFTPAIASSPTPCWAVDAK